VHAVVLAALCATPTLASSEPALATGAPRYQRTLELFFARLRTGAEPSKEDCDELKSIRRELSASPLAGPMAPLFASNREIMAKAEAACAVAEAPEAPRQADSQLAFAAKDAASAKRLFDQAIQKIRFDGATPVRVGVAPSPDRPGADPPEPRRRPPLFVPSPQHRTGPAASSNETTPPAGAEPGSFSQYLMQVKDRPYHFISLDSLFEGAAGPELQRRAWGAARAVIAFLKKDDARFGASRPLANWLRDMWLESRSSGRFKSLSLIVRDTGELDLRSDYADGSGFAVIRANFGTSTSYGQSWGQWLRSVGNTQPALIVHHYFELKPEQAASPLDALQNRWREYLSDGGLQEWKIAAEPTRIERGAFTGEQKVLDVRLLKLDVAANDSSRWVLQDPKGESQKSIPLTEPGSTSISYWMYDRNPPVKLLIDGVDWVMGWTGWIGTYTVGGVFNAVYPAVWWINSSVIPGSWGEMFSLDAKADWAKDPLINWAGNDFSGDRIKNLSAGELAQLDAEVKAGRKRFWRKQLNDPEKIESLSDVRRHPPTEEERKLAFARLGLLTWGNRLCEAADDRTGVDAAALRTACGLFRARDVIAISAQDPLVLGTMGLSVVPAAAKLGTTGFILRTAGQTVLVPSFIVGTGSSIVDLRHAYELGETSKGVLAGTDAATNLGLGMLLRRPAQPKERRK